MNENNGIGLCSVLSHALTHEQKLNEKLREHVLDLELELAEERKKVCKFWDTCRSTCTIEQ